MNQYILCLPILALLAPLPAETTPDRPEQPIVLNSANLREDARTLAAGLSDFAWQLNRILCDEQQDNLIWSPASLHSALLALRAGARGDTARALDVALRLPTADELWTSERRHAAYRALVGLQMGGEDKAGELRMSDALWTDPRSPIPEETVALLRDIHGAHVESIDFEDPLAADSINHWASKATKGLIPMLITTPLEGPLVLTNALYFASAWEDKFSKELTAPASFHLKNGEEVQVPTMQGAVNARFFKNELVTLVELNYARHETSMLILLPADDEARLELERSLNDELLEKWLESATNKQVNLHLPKFDLGGESVSLEQALARTGLGMLFNQEADLTGFGSYLGGLWVGDVVQACRLSVDEEETVAAAATAATFVIGCAVVESVSMDVDRPFMFVLREKSSGGVLLMGRVADPRG